MKSGQVFAALWMAGVSVGVSEGVHAQVRPDAGRALEGVQSPGPSVPTSSVAALPAVEDRPALAPGDGERVSVKRWKITGAHAFPLAELNALIDEYAGPDVTFAQLNAVAARITAHYRQHGYLLARAYLPAQEISDGVVEVAVLEGRLAEVRVANTSRVVASVLDRRTERLPVREPLNGRKLERSLLLLSDLPGVEVRSTLKPGAAVGTSDLDLQVRGTQRLDGSVDADSFGNRYTGELRGGGTLNVNNSFGHGDQFTLRALTAGSGMSYGRVSWRTPVCSDGMSAGVAASYLDYSLRKEFESLDAQGTARVGTLWLSYPLTRGLLRNLKLQLSYDNKRLDDEVRATATETRKDIDVWNLGVAGDWTDRVGGGGSNSYELTLTQGRVSTTGGYTKLSYNFGRLQRLSNRFSLYAALGGQISDRNLDSSEKQSLGGGYAVRAYPEGESAGDEAAVMNLELRYILPQLPEVQAVLFADAGVVSETDNHRTLSGEGIGVQWLHERSFAAKAHVAWRSGPQPASGPDRHPRFWMQFAKYF